MATYYNDVYSEDALIALTENALFDVERIEVLRGPQGPFTDVTQLAARLTTSPSVHQKSKQLFCGFSWAVMRTTNSMGLLVGHLKFHKAPQAIV